MKRLPALAAILVLLAVPVGILLIVLGVTGNQRVGTENVSATPTPGKGEVTMVDPQGDADLANKVLPWASHKGPVQIVLSRKVAGGDLNCIGFAGSTSLEMRPADTFGLVVLGGDMVQNVPATTAHLQNLPYIEYIYDLKYPGVTGQGSLAWSVLRAAFGGTMWPADSPMYVSSDGQPGLGELESTLPRFTNLSGAVAQDVNLSKKIGDWAVTVRKLYVRQRSLTVVYSVTGPRQRYQIFDSSLTVGGRILAGDAGNSGGELLGPSVNPVTFYGLPDVKQPQTIKVQFAVPELHIRPTRFPCDVPGPKAEGYPTPTPVSGMFIPDLATPVPDVQTLGPFTFDLEVQVDPEPTQPPEPSPVPTKPYLVPLPVPSTQP